MRLNIFQFRCSHSSDKVTIPCSSNAGRKLQLNELVQITNFLWRCKNLHTLVLFYFYLFSSAFQTLFQLKIDTKTTNQLEVNTELYSSAVCETIENRFPFVFEAIQFRTKSESKKTKKNRQRTDKKFEVIFCIRIG